VDIIPNSRCKGKRGKWTGKVQSAFGIKEMVVFVCENHHQGDYRDDKEKQLVPFRQPFAFTREVQGKYQIVGR
jgi:hypothetical protein